MYSIYVCTVCNWNYRTIGSLSHLEEKISPLCMYVCRQSAIAGNVSLGLSQKLHHMMTKYAQVLSMNQYDAFDIKLPC